MADGSSVATIDRSRSSVRSESSASIKSDLEGKNDGGEPKMSVKEPLGKGEEVKTAQPINANVAPRRRGKGKSFKRIYEKFAQN